MKKVFITFRKRLKFVDGKRQNLYICLIIILLSLFTVFYNFDWGTSFVGEDYGLGYNFPEVNRNISYFSWDSYFAFGKNSKTSSINFLWNNIIYFLSKIGLGPFALPRFLIFTFFIFSGFSFFLLFKYLIKIHFQDSYDEKNISQSAFIASLFYMFNPFTAHLLSFVISPFQFFYCMFPLFFYFLLRNIYEPFSFRLNIKLVIIFLFLANVNPAHALVALFISFIYILFFLKEILVRTSRKISQLIGGSIIFFILIFFLWLIFFYQICLYKAIRMVLLILKRMSCQYSAIMSPKRY